MNNHGYLVQQSGREPDERDLHLSQTTVSNAALCGMRVGYRGQDGYDYTPSEAMSFGTMVHGAIEADLGLIGTPVCGNWDQRALEYMWGEGLMNERDGSFDLYSLASRERIDKSTAEALLAVNEWHKHVLPVLPVGMDDTLLIEERVTKQLGTLPDGRAVWFGGTADLVLPDRSLVVDWKTAGRGWDESKAQHTVQASYYTWLYEIPNHLYWVWNRRSSKWDGFETTRSDHQVEAALLNAWKVALSMHHGTFTASPLQDNWGKVKRGWHCSAKFCGAWEICEFKYLNDDVWEGQRINPKDGWQ